MPAGAGVDALAAVRDALGAAALAWSVLCGDPRAAAADSLTMASPVPRLGTAAAVLRLDPAASGRGRLRVVWTDDAGRMVMLRTAAVTLDHAKAITIPLDARRAEVMMNRLEARLVLDGTPARESSVAFVAVPAPTGRGADGWDYPIIIWQDQTPARAAGLRRLGIGAGRVFGVRGELTEDTVAQRVAPLLAADLRFYVENIATDFYAAYHRYQPDRPVTWAFDQVRALHARDPSDPAAFRRVPSLSDPAALDAVRARLAQHVRRFGPYRPLYYSLGDETGIADLAAAWDFDRSPVALAQFRLWLRARYGALPALNRQWGTDFAGWGDVLPMTTDRAIADPAENFSAWADFKDFMDAAFAHAVQAGTRAIHAAAPPGQPALSAIEGAQIPGWGGYDYARLAGAVDVMEMYDAGNNEEIAQALNPRLAVLTTTTPAGEGALAQAERGRLWHELLLGNRGLILWDEAAALVDDQGRPTALGTSYGALFDEFGSGLAAQWDAAAQPAAPVAILYSPPSFRIGWLLDRRSDHRQGALAWTTRDAETEGGDSALRSSMRGAAALLTHLALPPGWISGDALQARTLQHRGIRVVLLPRAIALSDAEVARLRAFAAAGGQVLADAPPGLYDAHGRRRPAPPLAGVADLVSGQWQPADLRGAGVSPPVSLTLPDGTIATDIDVRMRQDGAVTLIGLQRDPDAAGAASGAQDVALTLTRPAQVYDLRRHRNLGWTSRVALSIGAAEPVMLALSPAPLPPLVLGGPRTALAGTDAVLRIGQRSGTPAAVRVLHVQTRDPGGKLVAIYSGNAALRGGSVEWRIPFAVNDRAGTWTVRVADRLGAEARTWRIVLRARALGAGSASN